MNTKKTVPKSHPGRSPRNVPVGSRNLLGYHSKKDKKSKKIKLSEGNLGALTEESKRCLENLAAYRPSKEALPQPWLPFPRSRRAAVLVALFVGRKGDLYVLLSKRASTLRSFAGDTSLPGGKMDLDDENIEYTARREAFEEIGLPLDPSKAPLLCMLEPFYVMKELLVTPVVVLILDNTLQPILNSTEVTALFSHPLASFLSSSPPASIIRSEPELVELGGDDTGYRYHLSNDWDWDGPPVVVHPSSARSGSSKHRRSRTRARDTVESLSLRDSQDNETHPRVDTRDKPILRKRKIRMHRFLTGREAGGIKPVYGLTAAIMIHTARIGFSIPSSSSPPSLASPDFEVAPADSPSMDMRIAWAFCRPSEPGRPNLLQEALREEGLYEQVYWEKARKLAGILDFGTGGVGKGGAGRWTAGGGGGGAGAGVGKASSRTTSSSNRPSLSWLRSKL